jgi:hypothetical protein
VYTACMQSPRSHATAAGGPTAAFPARPPPPRVRCQELVRLQLRSGHPVRPPWYRPAPAPGPGASAPAAAAQASRPAEVGPPAATQPAARGAAAAVRADEAIEPPPGPCDGPWPDSGGSSRLGLSSERSADDVSAERDCDHPAHATTLPEVSVNWEAAKAAAVRAAAPARKLPPLRGPNLGRGGGAVPGGGVDAVDGSGGGGRGCGGSRAPASSQDGQAAAAEGARGLPRRCSGPRARASPVRARLAACGSGGGGAACGGAGSRSGAYGEGPGGAAAAVPGTGVFLTRSRAPRRA